MRRAVGGTLAIVMVLAADPVIAQHLPWASPSPSPSPTPAPPVPMPPPVFVAPAPPMPDPWIVQYSPSTPRCGATERRWTTTPLPNTQVVMDGSLPSVSRPVVLTFRIDADGHTGGIASTGGDRPDEIATDLEAVVSAMRFAAGRPVGNCAITFTPARTLAGAAGTALLYEALVGNRYDVRGMERVRQRLGMNEDGSCDTGTPDPLKLMFADFPRDRRPPGQPLTTVIALGVDANGVPTGVKLLRGSGNAEYDRLALAATRDSRYERRAFAGCLTGTQAYPETMLFEPTLTAPDLRPPGSSCGTVGWISIPEATVPEQFRERAMQGWAIVGFDVGPDGRPINVKSLRAEPADIFGYAAVDVVAGGVSQDRSLRACTVRVLFKVNE